MLKNKNKFTGQERVGHKPVVCSRCGNIGGVKGTSPLVKKQDGTYVHQGLRCPLSLKLPDERMA